MMILLFTDNSKYIIIIINQKGQWTDSIGNYGASECKGLIKRNDKNIIDFLDVICQSTNQNNVVTWRKIERTGSEIERGVKFLLLLIVLVNIKNN